MINGYVRFFRLFDLATNKLAIVSEMSVVGWGVDGGGWNWRSMLFLATNKVAIVTEIFVLGGRWGRMELEKEVVCVGGGVGEGVCGL